MHEAHTRAPIDSHLQEPNGSGRVKRVGQRVLQCDDAAYQRCIDCPRVENAACSVLACAPLTTSSVSAVGQAPVGVSVPCPVRLLQQAGAKGNHLPSRGRHPRSQIKQRLSDLEVEKEGTQAQERVTAPGCTVSV